jgi:23S rRNA (adenine-N6)-dimethyltransferase
MFDPKKRNHRILYAQNFLKNPSTARYLVKIAEIKTQDTVLEVGPGRGVITDALLEVSGNLILIEKDKILVQELNKRYQAHKSVKIINADVLKYNIDIKDYKVFSNPPFNISSQIIKKFLFDKYSPSHMYLFLQKEATERFQGKLMENQLSILIKTWYEVSVIYKFKRTDFNPAPAVDVYFVKFSRRDGSLVKIENKSEYILFVQYGFQQQKANLMKNFNKLFTYNQWKRLAHDHKFNIKSQPSDLSAHQWSALFDFYQTGVSEDKKYLLKNYKPQT